MPLPHPPLPPAARRPGHNIRARAAGAGRRASHNTLNIRALTYVCAGRCAGHNFLNVRGCAEERAPRCATRNFLNIRAS